MQCVQKVGVLQSYSFSSEFYINLLLDVVLNYTHTSFFRLKTGQLDFNLEMFNLGNREHSQKRLHLPV